jgi:hypothetical protein
VLIMPSTVWKGSFSARRTGSSCNALRHNTEGQHCDANMTCYADIATHSFCT